MATYNSFNTTAYEDSYLRPCVCTEEEKVDTPKSFCYSEGTELDRSTADNVEELSENVWFESKPPRLFKTDCKPLITARQIHVTRIVMNGAPKMLGTEEDDRPMTPKVITKVIKKRSAKRFLSTSIIDED
ncbi:hypothetical protein NQ318_005116 [Aromia moschata]|uniref:Uncharacterized protein n=1 Tax=Aromia moschata TaxID=1265417 RepID=A0AAV8XU16_9CUCU|nr:hypothetical protein NQ318_005116 [Aromia moschata]